MVVARAPRVEHARRALTRRERDRARPAGRPAGGRPAPRRPAGRRGGRPGSARRGAWAGPAAATGGGERGEEERGEDGGPGAGLVHHRRGGLSSMTVVSKVSPWRLI